MADTRRERHNNKIDALTFDISELKTHDFYNVKDKIENEASRRFTARIRYLGTSSVITIPVKIMRELNIKLGDYIEIQICKKDMNDIE